MARAVIALGPIPARESAVRVSGRADADIASAECRRYIQLVRNAIGAERGGARLHVVVAVTVLA